MEGMIILKWSIRYQKFAIIISEIKCSLELKVNSKEDEKKFPLK